MTTVKKLKMYGFKSFAKPTDLPFSKEFSVVIGSNGSGKSCSYSTLVQKKDGSEVKIGKLVEKQLKKNPVKTLKDGIYCESKKPIEVISINPITMKQETKSVSKFIKREGEELYHIKTRTRKEIKATGCHPVMIFKDGKLKSTLIRNLKEHDLIATPRNIKTHPKKNFNKKKARLLGYIIGDGYIAKSRIEFINKDKEIIKDYKNILKSLYKNPNIKERKDKGATRLYIDNKKIVKEIRGYFIKNHNNSITSDKKNIPNIILKTNKDIIRQLLAGLYDTDGYIRKDLAIIEFCSKNKKMVQRVQRLLLRFDIISKIKKRISCAYNTKNKIKRNYWYLYIYGQENLKKFYINIPLKCIHKKNTLEEHSKRNKTPNPNNDLLPKETNFYIRKLSNLLGIKIKKNLKKYPRLSPYLENRCLPTREGVLEILNFFYNKLELIKQTIPEIKPNKDSLINTLDILNISHTSASKSIGLSGACITNHWIYGTYNGKKENIENLYSFLQSTIKERLKEIKEIFLILENLATSEIYWDEITSIKKVKKEPYVYDLTIPNNHNFIGNGIFIHNSNIIDALCFVLGRLSAKSMRAEKSANLIYNGGKDGKAAKEASVSIVFDNSKKEFPSEADEIEIKRIVKQNGLSKYLINNEIRTRQQVLDLLSAAKINPDGYNIVLQGDITAITEMASDQRREVIEEISGISVYEDKKEKSIRELEKVDIKLKEAEIILVERETYLKELKKDHDQALKYKELEKNIKRNKATFLYQQIKDKQEKIQENSKKIEKNKKEINKHQNSIQERQQEISNKQEQITNLNQEIEEKGEIKQIQLHEEIEQLKEDFVKNSARISSLKNEVERIKERKRQLQKNIEETDKKTQDLLHQKSSLEKKLNNISTKRTEIESELNKNKQKYEINELNTNLEKIDSQIDSIKNELEDLQEKKLDLLKNKNKLEVKLSLTEETLSKFTSKQELEKLTQLKQQLKNLEKELENNLDQDSILSTQLDSCRFNLHKNQEKLLILKVKQNSINENLIIKKLKNSNIRGIYGTVAELSRVEEKFSLPLEVAAGSRLYSIVVESDKVAEKCINYLKQNHIGRAIFLPLNKLNPIKIQNSLQKYGYGLALNLIKFELKFRKAFEFVFGNTVVVNNIQEARKIGIGKLRMVTLDGNLTEVSGAMIGGFRKKISLTLQDSQKIKELEKNVLEQKDLLKRLEKRRYTNEGIINKQKKEKSNLESQIIKIESLIPDLSKLNKEKSELILEVKKINTNLETFKQKIQENNNQLTTLTADKNNLRSKITKIRTQKITQYISNLENEDRIITENQIETKNQIKIINTQIQDMLDPEKENIIRIIKQHNQEINEFSQEIQELTKITIEQKSIIKKKEKIEKKFYKNYKDLFNKRNKLQQEIQKRELKINNNENKIEIYQERLNNISIEKAKIVSELQGLKQEFQQFSDVPIRKNITLEQLKEEIRKFEIMQKQLGNVNLRALEIYENINEEYKKLQLKVDKLKTEKNDILNLIEEIESKKTAIFMRTFNSISSNFENIFSQLTKKGTAHLVLEDPEKPLNAGIRILVKITQNKFLDIKSLSGGEKTLTALAFIFTLQEYDPASFYILDEVDAALDKTNSEMLAELLRRYSQKAQYIIISHNDSIISAASQLYGVSMRENGISNVVSLKL